MSPAASSAAVLYGPRDVRVEDRLLWPPAKGHAQVAVVATGLCGSDLHYYSHGRNGDFAVRAPLVLGHEAAGIVTAVSRDVSDHLLKVGQRVAIEAGISCRTCSFCESGRYNLCKNMRFCSSAARFPHVDGTLQTRINHPAHVLHPLPDDVSFELAALAEPLSVLIHAARRVQLGSVPNEAVLVFGVGAIGLLACALARHRGARRVVAVDINPQRLDFARRHAFADDVFCLPAPSTTSPSAPAADPCCSINRPASQPPPAPTAATTADQVLAKAQATAAQLLSHFAQPDGFDVVFECTGAESAVQMSVYAAAPGARVMLVGMGTRAAYMPVAAFALREVDVRGSFRYAGTYPEALALLRPVPADKRTLGADGKPRATLPELVAKLVTHRFPLAETQRAFEMLARGTDDAGGLVLKVIVEGAPDDAA